MKNIVKKKVAGRGMNNCMTNIANLHTCAAGSVDLIMPTVTISNCELLQFTSHMICSPTVSIPICVHTIGFGGSPTVLLIFIIAKVALLGFMVCFLADLTRRLPVALLVAALVVGEVLVVVVRCRKPLI